MKQHVIQLRATGFGIAYCLIMIFSVSVGASAQPVQFFSNQLTPLPEATILQNVILRRFSVPVDFWPVDGQKVTYAQAIQLAGSGTSSVVLGGLDPDFRLLGREGLLGSADELWRGLSDRDFEPGLRKMAKLGNSHEYYVPWMQATYLMAASRQALRYLPRGASLNNLTYAQLEQWAKNMYVATGEAKLGFPAGPNGLMSRFLEGYLTPSFVGNPRNTFSGAQAEDMWRYIRSLWRYVTPSSFVFTRMDQALLNGHVWLAWDHSARLLGAFRRDPGKFVAFPAPVGPRGRGYLRIVVGLGVPREHIKAASAQLITYLTSPRTQALILRHLGFLPVVSIPSSEDVPKSLRDFLKAAAEQMDSPESKAAEQPSFSGADSRRFNLIYLNAFSSIVLRGEDIPEVLSVQRPKLAELLKRQRNGVTIGNQ